MINTQETMEVLQHWTKQLGITEEIEATHEKLEGLQVTTFFVTSEYKNRFVLKNVLNSPNATRLDSEYQLLQYLHDCDIPVAVPVLTDEGQLSIRNTKGIYLLYPVLQTDEVDALPVSQRTVYTNIGYALAKLHKALSSYPNQIKSWTMDLPKTISDEAIPKIQGMLTDENLMKFNRTIEAIQPDMNEILNSLPVQYIHGDCHLGNILFYHGEVSGFIDLDHLPQGSTLYDIGYLLADMSKGQFFGNIAHSNWMEDFNCVLTGYEKVTHLSTYEHQAIWFMMLATQLMFAYWLFKYENSDAAQKNLEALYWLYEGKQKILQQMSSATV